MPLVALGAVLMLVAGCDSEQGVQAEQAEPSAAPTRAEWSAPPTQAELSAPPTLSDVLPPLVPAMALPDNAVENAVAKLDGMAEDLMRESGIPGMAVAVVHGGKTVYAKGFGVKDVRFPSGLAVQTAGIHGGGQSGR